MISPFRNKDHSNSNNHSEEKRKKKDIKERDEVLNNQKFVHLADSSAGGEADENLDIDMDEPKDNLVPKLRMRIHEEDEIKVLRRVRTKSENDQLVGWIQNNKNKKVKASLKDPSLRHSVDDSGRTLLHISAACGNVTATDHILDIFDVDARDLNGRTALMLAIEYNHAKVVEMLLSLSDINVLDNEGKDFLHLGFAKKDLSKEILILLLRELGRRYGNSEVIAEKLVDSGCQMYQAVCARNMALVKSMLARGANVNAADPETKRTALHMAVVLGEPEIVQVLLEAGADAQALDIDGISPLLCNYAFPDESRNHKKLAILDLLLARKVPLTTTIKSGLFQVSTTLTFGCAEAISRLLRSGYLDFSVVDAIDDWRPIHYLASNCNRGVAQQLKLNAAQYDYHVNATDGNSYVPLHMAIKKGSVEMVRFLLEQGAHANHAVTKKNIHGSTPIYILFFLDPIPFESECLEALLQHKADPQAILTHGDGKVFGTLFDLEQRSMRLRPVVAHLALIERQREPIAELILDKIHSRAEIRKYFKRCQAILDKKLFGSITVLNLLTDSQKKVMSYLSNPELRFKLKTLNKKLRIQNSFWYYFNVLRKRVVMLLRLKGLRTEAAGIVCKWFENPLDKKHIVIERMLDFLDVSSLEQLISL